MVLGAALAGAVVGGAATGVGSYMVGRTQRRHDARVSLYLDLLPELRTESNRPTHSHDDGRTSDAISLEIGRISTVAGSRAITLARSVHEAMIARERPLTKEELEAARPIGAGSMKRIDRSAEWEALEGAISNFDVWLERKIKGGWAALRP